MTDGQVIVMVWWVLFSIYLAMETVRIVRNK